MLRSGQALQFSQARCVSCSFRGFLAARRPPLRSFLWPSAAPHANLGNNITFYDLSAKTWAFMAVCGGLGMAGVLLFAQAVKARARLGMQFFSLEFRLCYVSTLLASSPGPSPSLAARTDREACTQKNEVLPAAPASSALAPLIILFSLAVPRRRRGSWAFWEFRENFAVLGGPCSSRSNPETFRDFHGRRLTSSSSLAVARLRNGSGSS